jgi:hypothetical protein
MSNENSIPSIIKETRDSASFTPAETKEPRQVTTTDDMHPDPSKSIKLPPNRQALIDDVIALYSCQPTIERVSRYAPNCVSDTSKDHRLWLDITSLGIGIGANNVALAQ